MRIVQVITKMDVGGAQETVFRLSEGLVGAGHDVTLLAGGDPGAGGDMWDGVAAASFAAERVAPLVRRISPLRDARALLVLTMWFRRNRPDVVHTHSSKAGVLGRAAAWFARVPVIVHTVHGWSFRPGQHWAVHALYLGAERLLARCTDAIAVVTEADREVGLAGGVGESGRYIVIRSGIDIAAWRASAASCAEVRREFGVPDAAAMIACVARLAPPKDPVTLVRALARVNAAAPYLVLFGDGPLLQDVEAAASREGVDSRVVFAGTRSDLPNILHCADVAVLSSRSEGLPRAVVEAMAARVPVVATDVGGVGEVVREGETGFLVPPGDPDAMARAIERALRDGPGLADDAHAAVAEFSQAEMIRRTIALYESAVTAS